MWCAFPSHTFQDWSWLEALIQPSACQSWIWLSWENWHPPWCVCLHWHTTSWPADRTSRISHCVWDALWMGVGRQHWYLYTHHSCCDLSCLLCYRWRYSLPILGGRQAPSLIPEEHSAVQHFKNNHYHTESGKFMVPLPKRESTKPIGESRSLVLVLVLVLVVWRFLSLEHTLHARGQFDEFNAVMKEYFDFGMLS